MASEQPVVYMQVVASLLFLLGIITIIYPIRAIGLSRRRYGVFMVIGALGMIIATADYKSVAKNASANSTTSGSSGYRASGSCKTDASGVFRCDHEASIGGITSTSQMRCRTNPVTDQYECKTETR